VNGGNGGGRLLLRDGEILLGGAANHPARHPSKYNNQYDKAVVRIRIRRIRKFLGLPDPDPLVRYTDPDLSIIKQK
jgi:hypothetical protein